MDNHVQNLSLAPILLTHFLAIYLKICSCQCTALCRLSHQNSVSIFHFTYMPYVPPPISSTRLHLHVHKDMEQNEIMKKTALITAQEFVI